jgi:hypothetical protein
MKRTIALSLLSVLILTACSDTETKEFGNAAISSPVMTKVDGSNTKASPSAEAVKTDFVQIKAKLGQFNDIDKFVAWLKACKNVTNVVHNRIMVFTSNPPTHVVSFSLDGIMHKLLLSVEVDNTIRLL